MQCTIAAAVSRMGVSTGPARCALPRIRLMRSSADCLARVGSSTTARYSAHEAPPPAPRWATCVCFSPAPSSRPWIGPVSPEGRLVIMSRRVLVRVDERPQHVRGADAQRVVHDLIEPVEQQHGASPLKAVGDPRAVVLDQVPGEPLFEIVAVGVTGEAVAGVARERGQRRKDRQRIRRGEAEALAALMRPWRVWPRATATRFMVVVWSPGCPRDRAVGLRPRSRRGRFRPQPRPRPTAPRRSSALTIEGLLDGLHPIGDFAPQRGFGRAFGMRRRAPW